MDAITFKTGGMWEFAQWEIQFDVDVTRYENMAPCAHCGPERTEEHKNAFGGTWTDVHFVCPRVVVQHNEAGCSTTGVCLDCIIEAAKALER